MTEIWHFLVDCSFFADWLVAGRPSSEEDHLRTGQQQNSFPAVIVPTGQQFPFPPDQINLPPAVGRSHICPLCGKGFPTKSELKRHNMIHTGLKPHKCQLCGRSFRQKPHLKSHMMIHHPDELH